MYNFLKRCIYEYINIKSTPLSCNQKKSSVYMSSISSSSLTIGTIIGSGTKLKDNITPEINWKTIVIITTKPKIEFTSWNETFKSVKYVTRLLKFRLRY